MTNAQKAARRKKIAAEVASLGGTRDDTYAVARKHGVTANLVWRACRDHGVGIIYPEPKAEIAVRTYAVIAALCASAETSRQIATRLGISEARVSQVYAACKEAGIPVKKKGGRK